mgnify:FL=1
MSRVDINKIESVVESLSDFVKCYRVEEWNNSNGLHSNDPERQAHHFAVKFSDHKNILNNIIKDCSV